MRLALMAGSLALVAGGLGLSSLRRRGLRRLLAMLGLSTPSSAALGGAAAYVGRDGKRYPLTEPRWCADGAGPPSPLMLTELQGITRADIRTGERSLWRYAASFPLPCPEPISLGEGCTPLLRREYGGHSVLFKCEWFNPTCSFKDRGTSVMLSLLRQQGVRAVLEDSSGNGGASVACYAAAGGLDATIMAPSSTSTAKTVAMRAHGSTVELIPGSRQATADAAVAAHGRDGGRVFYASHNWCACTCHVHVHARGGRVSYASVAARPPVPIAHAAPFTPSRHPFFLQGTKTLAYELWEDLGFKAPDNVIIPTGAGSNILGCDLGFGELQRAGEIANLPRLFCAQPLVCSPIATAVLEATGVDDGQRAPSEWNTPAKTVAEGTSIMVRPPRAHACGTRTMRMHTGCASLPCILDLG